MILEATEVRILKPVLSYKSLLNNTWYKLVEKMDLPSIYRKLAAVRSASGPLELFSGEEGWSGGEDEVYPYVIFFFIYTQA